MEWLDQKVLRQLADDIGHEMMPVVISVFVEEVGEQLAQLRPLFEQRDWSALARVAHSMKSSCGSYGAKPSYQQVMDLESACRREDEQEAGRLLAELEHSCPRSSPIWPSFTEPEGHQPAMSRSPSLLRITVSSASRSLRRSWRWGGRFTQLGPERGSAAARVSGALGSQNGIDPAAAIRSSSQRC